MEALKARIRSLIASRQALRERYSREVVIQPSAVTAPSADEAFLEKVQAAVERHMRRSDFTVEVLAEEVGMSKSQLTRKLRALTGMAPAAFIRAFRLQRAAQLLEKRNPVAQVAYAVGFTDKDHFSKLFKQEFGVSPSHYRADDA